MKSLLIVLFTVTLLFVKTQSNEIDAIKLSNDAVNHCARNKEDEERLREVVLQEQLPENDNDFTNFYECFCKRLHILDEEGIMNLDVVRVVYSDYINKIISSTADAMKLTNEAIDNCEKIPVSKPAGLYAIKRRNCGNKFILQHVQ